MVKNMNWVLPVKQDAITERTPDFNTGYFLESRNMCMILQRRQHKWKVIPVTGNRGKRVFPSRCNLPRKEAAVNFSCPFGVSQRIQGIARCSEIFGIVLGMIEEGASDEMILKHLKISKERLEQIKKNQKVHV